MRLVDGARAIAGDLPASATVVIDVPLEAGEAQESGVSRFTSLQLVRDRQAIALSEVPDWALTIGGDCAVELASVSHVADTRNVALVWFDAHPDLNTPASSPSGAFHGMIVRTLLGDGPAGLVPARPLSPDHLVLVGTRSFDDPEDEYIAEAGISVIDGDNPDAGELIAAIEATGAESVYIHVDLDVLDPGEIDGVGYPEPFGLSPAKLVELIKVIKARFPVAGAGITEFAPRSPEQASDDLPTILRIIGALTSA
jgi:arginase